MDMADIPAPEQLVRWPYPRHIYLLRFLWIVTWKTIWPFCWHRFRILRTFILKVFGARIAGRVSIFSTVRIEMPWDLSIGENVSIGPRVHLYNLGGLSIGSHTSISQDAYLCGGTHDHTTLAYPLLRKKITVGNYVWIAAGAFIGPGVTIGDGAVVGARAVVMKDVAPWTIVAGNPAKFVKERKLRHALPPLGAGATDSPSGAIDRPLRILHLVSSSDAGGLSRYVYDLCTALHARGHQVAVAGDRGPWHWLFENAPWPWIDLPISGGPLGVWRGMRILRKYLKTHPVDLIHSHYRRTNLIARMVRPRNWAGRIPTLFTLHSSYMPLVRPRWLFSGLGDHVHAISAGAGQWLQNDARIAPDRLTVIPHGIDPARFPPRTQADRQAARTELGLSPTGRVAAYVGRFDSPKNEGWIVDLAAASQSDLPDLHLLLLGEGPHEAQLKQRIEREGLADRVRVLSSRDPLRIYQAIDALLLPSGREGFSLVCAEAMSVGVPVLRTRTSGTSELIVEGVTGRSTDINHDAFLADAKEFLADRDALAAMGRAAAEHIRQNFTFEQQVKQTIALYRRLIAAGVKGRPGA